MASSNFSFLVLWTLWANQINYLREKKSTIGINFCKIMVNQLAFVGADQQDVVGNSHRGDQATTLAYIPFQSIDKEHASLAIPCKGIQIGQIVLRLQLWSHQYYMTNNNGFFFLLTHWRLHSINGSLMVTDSRHSIVVTWRAKQLYGTQRENFHTRSNGL